MVEDRVRGEGVWCPFRYEFLPNFYYVCGRLGHVEKECDYVVGDEEEEKQFGDWLRVTPAKGRTNSDSRGRWFDGGSSGGSRPGRNWEGSRDNTGREKGKVLLGQGRTLLIWILISGMTVPARSRTSW